MEGEPAERLLETLAWPKAGQALTVLGQAGLWCLLEMQELPTRG